MILAARFWWSAAHAKKPQVSLEPEQLYLQPSYRCRSWLSCSTVNQHPAIHKWDCWHWVGPLSAALKAEVHSSFITMTVWEQHPRSHNKGATSRVLTGYRWYPVLCANSLGMCSCWWKACQLPCIFSCSTCHHQLPQYQCTKPEIFTSTSCFVCTLWYHQRTASITWVEYSFSLQAPAWWGLTLAEVPLLYQKCGLQVDR